MESSLLLPMPHANTPALRALPTQTYLTHQLQLIWSTSIPEAQRLVKDVNNS